MREELEKEEFYVEYLERLLADVERHKQNTNNSCPTTSPSAESKNDFAKKLARQERRPIIGETVGEEETPSPVTTPDWQTRDIIRDPVSLPASNTISDISKLQDKCVSELSCALTLSRRPKSEIPGSLEKNLVVRRNSDPDVPSNYVTVIEVTGSSKKEKIGENGGDDGDEDENFENDNENGGKIGEDDVAEDGGVEGDAEASEEEPYYDSVALDQTGEYVYIDARVPIVTNNNGNSAGGSGGCIGNSNSNSKISSSSSNNSNSGGRAPIRRPPSLPDSPGNRSNYVNIDYFIQ